MKLASLRIQEYRSIEDLSLSLDSYSAFVGANGSGKSAVLHAIEWFFTGKRSDSYDFRVRPDGSVADEFSVTATLTDLTEVELARWSRYLRTGALELRRSAIRSGGDQLSGRASQGPGFNDVRRAASAVERRALYSSVRESLNGLPRVNSQVDIERALDDWESDPSNAGDLEEVPNTDLAHAFGFNGKNLLHESVQFVLVPASARLEDNVDPAGKGGAIDQLLGAVVKLAAEKEVAEWSATHRSDLDALGAKITAAVDLATRVQTDSTNEFLGETIKGAEVRIDALTGEPKLEPRMEVKASFVFEGSSMPISKQGHGVQRSVMMSTLQAASRTSGSGSSTTFLAIEEPELYQHPARSIALSRALKKLSQSGGWQVAIATHSPNFLGTRGAASIRRFAKSADEVSVVDGSLTAFARAADRSEDVVAKHLETLLPTEFANAYFADRVLLVEGITDKVVLGRVAELLDCDIDSRNWAIVNCEGKGNIPIAAAILNQLGIDVRVVFDGDFRGDLDDVEHKKATNDLLKDLRRIGLLQATDQYRYGQPSVSFGRVSVLESDLESELRAWPSYQATVVARTGGNRTKNPYIVREAAEGAVVDDCPAPLLDVVKMFDQEA